MDVASFALGVAAGAVALVGALAAFVALKVRRLGGVLPLLGGLRPRAPTRPGPRVETDKDGYILPKEEPE
ncbi:MAG: hypothetical protein WDA16_05895 [Candidatus Thermoplasmatota archaeon]